MQMPHASEEPLASGNKLYHDKKLHFTGSAELECSDALPWPEERSWPTRSGVVRAHLLSPGANSDRQPRSAMRLKEHSNRTRTDTRSLNRSALPDAVAKPFGPLVFAPKTIFVALADRGATATLVWDG